MADVFYAKKDEAPSTVLELPVDAAIGIEIGDLCYLATDDVRPASSQVDQTSETLNQLEFARNFLGIAVSRDTATATVAGVVRVQTTGIFQLTCASDTYEVGNYVAADEDTGGTFLEDQQVKKTADRNSAIGIVVARVASADTKVWVKIVSRVAGNLADQMGQEVGIFVDDVPAIFGTGSDVNLLWSTADASDHSFVLALGDTSQMLHVTDLGAKASDWAITSPTHPNVYIHSNTTPITDYLRIGGHTGTVADIDIVGGTTIQLMADGTAMVTITATAVTLADAQNLVLNTTTGTKIGTATSQKLGFWNTTPVVQPVGAGQGALTDSSGGSGSTVPLVGNTMAGNEAANINNGHFAIVTLLHAIRTALVNTGLIKGAA